MISKFDIQSVIVISKEKMYMRFVLYVQSVHVWAVPWLPDYTLGEGNFRTGKRHEARNEEPETAHIPSTRNILLDFPAFNGSGLYYRARIEISSLLIFLNVFPNTWWMLGPWVSQADPLSFRLILVQWIKLIVLRSHKLILSKLKVMKMFLRKKKSFIWAIKKVLSVWIWTRYVNIYYWYSFLVHVSIIWAFKKFTQKR